VLIKNAFKQAMRWGLVHRNPTDLVDPPRQDRREMRAFSAAEARRFLEAVADERYLILFATAIATGCRPSEYLGMKWADFDWQAGTVTIQRSLIWARSRCIWTIGPPKTPRSRRTLSLPPPVLEALGQHRLRQDDDRRKAGAGWQDLDLVFTRPHGAPLGIWDVRDKFKQAVKSAGLPDMPLYSLRHTTATVLMMTGENPKVVQERMGHANVSITLGIYSHVLPGMQDQATKRLEKAIFEARRTH
jgi:integrase